MVTAKQFEKVPSSFLEDKSTTTTRLSRVHWNLIVLGNKKPEIKLDTIRNQLLIHQPPNLIGNGSILLL